MAATAQADFAAVDPFAAALATSGLESQPFEAAKRERLVFIERAVAGIARGDGAPAALRELSAFLLDLLSLVGRDPGLELAADDLHDAATMLAAERGPEAGARDPRRRRLLDDACRRFRERLDLAGPSGRAQLMGYC